MTRTGPVFVAITLMAAACAEGGPNVVPAREPSSSLPVPREVKPEETAVEKPTTDGPHSAEAPAGDPQAAPTSASAPQPGPPVAPTPPQAPTPGASERFPDNFTGECVSPENESPHLFAVFVDGKLDEMYLSLPIPEASYRGKNMVGQTLSKEKPLPVRPGRSKEIAVSFDYPGFEGTMPSVRGKLIVLLSPSLLRVKAQYMSEGKLEVVETTAPCIWKR